MKKDSAAERNRELIRTTAVLAKLERDGARLARRLESRIRESTIRALTSRTDNLDVEGIVVGELGPALREASLLAYLTGQYRARLRVSRITGKNVRVVAGETMQLSATDRWRDAIANLRRLLRLPKSEVDLLRDQYGAQVTVQLTRVASRTTKTLTDVVDRSLMEGRTISQTRRDVSRAMAAVGLGSAGDHQIEAMFRTRTQEAFSAGRWVADHDPDVADLIWGYEYSTVGDDRVRPNHAAVDGTVLPKSDPWWRIWWSPNGWNCRCTQIELLSETRIVPPPSGIAPDPGFAYNAGIVAQ